jgi:hypothetical protein
MVQAYSPAGIGSKRETGLMLVASKLRIAMIEKLLKWGVN